MPPKKSYLFSSESVSEGHPDKVADQISDAVLDAALDQDLNAKVACETLITRGLVVAQAADQQQRVGSGAGIEMQHGGRVDHHDCLAVGLDAQVQPVWMGCIRRGLEVVQAGDEQIRFGLPGEQAVQDCVHRQPSWVTRSARIASVGRTPRRDRGQPPPHSLKKAQALHASGA